MKATPTTHPNPQVIPPVDVLREYGCLTDLQISSITGCQVNTVRKQMVQLEKRGQVKRFNRRKGGSGRPTKVSCLPQAKWATSSTREHQIALNDVRIAFHHAWSSYPKLKVQTWDTQSVVLQEGVRSEAKDSHVRPDGIVLLNHPHSNQALLVFIEVDMGTEPLRSSRISESSWSQKAGLYRETPVLRRWSAWAGRQGGLGNNRFAYRLAVVSTNSARIAGICEVLIEYAVGINVWAARIDQVCCMGFQQPIWTRGTGLGAQHSFLEIVGGRD